MNLQNFLNQNETSDEVLFTFPSSGDYTVLLEAINFNGVRNSEEIDITIDQLTNPIPSFTYSSNDDYSIQTFVNTTPDTDSVLWTLDGGCELANGSQFTDETIDVIFSSSGEFTIGLQVTSVGFDENGNPVEFTSEDVNESIPVSIITSRAEIPEPVLLAGGFERPIDAYLSEEGLARTNNDLGKEYWLPDGISQRVLTPGTNTLFPAYPGETDANLQTWFLPDAPQEFNRLGTTSNARTGDAAASWDARTQLRAGVQRIEVTPGVDYRVTFWYENVDNATDVSLLALVLDENVVAENQIGSQIGLTNAIPGIDNSIIAQGAFNEAALGYIEETITFNAGNRDAIKLYFNTSEFFGVYRLDDVSITID